MELFVAKILPTVAIVVVLALHNYPRLDMEEPDVL